MMETILDYFLKLLPWIAVLALPIGYWKQVLHIHHHKEVRDLNPSAFILFLIAYISLGIEAVIIDSDVFLWKNILVSIPTIVIIWQIFRYKDSQWVEYDDIKEKAGKAKSLNKRINMKGKEEEDSKD